jgi:transposase
MGQRKTFTPEFKREAVQLLESESRPASQIARELGIKRNQLYKWQMEWKTHGGAAFPRKGMRSQRNGEGVKSLVES